jgi:hypothetical protein
VDFAYLINFTIHVGLRAAAALGIVKQAPAIADMDLQPVAVMLQLVHPARPGLGAAWRRLAGMDE